MKSLDFSFDRIIMFSMVTFSYGGLRNNVRTGYWATALVASLRAVVCSNGFNDELEGIWKQTVVA
jgi:hypothetical protein